MPHRFYFEGSFDSDQLLLEGSEAHHLLHVLRMQAGDSVLIFNGTGAEAEAVIAKTSRKTVEIKITERREIQASTQVPVILATAVPKGDRFRWLVEKAAELGVTRLVPLITERSSVDPGENRLKKLQQTIVAAAKQSGQTRLMELAPQQKWDDFLAECCQSDHRILIADPGGSALDLFSRSFTDSVASPVILLIGPEGGFSPEELQSAIETGAKSVKLSEGILRIETAAILFAGLVCLALNQTE
ncbi:RsmE family RNA methyltransferase [uncultured Gimesia sp.]|uniref:RsmE family RNA methyltransferase n=1 Tax=uncultured Gimesia sp. TaxID=1678688 RepID=UPI0026257C94|nr:RsmE family RNA methyltransferase [uncultured Gimesia sp.]